MRLKDIIDDFNILKRCREYSLPLWQCPKFLFLTMGVVIIVGLSIVNLALVNNYIESPEVVALTALILTAISLVIAFVTTQVLENLASVSRMKSEFISIVSHQLRSPLSNLKWAIELLMSGRLGKIEEKQTEYFHILKENSARMHELISDLLVISRMETAGFFSKKTPFSLTELTKEIIERFSVFAKSSNISIVLDSRERTSDVIANSNHIQLVVENFLDNAIRYVKQSGDIKIKIENRNGKIYFEIKDNGVGIPNDDQKYIFQKFFRAKNVMKYQTQGSGLGLYIAKNIIEKSNGKIGFKSKENEGSTFWFTLPLIKH